MRLHTDSPRHARGTVLIASASRMFVDIVDDMVTRCGFTPATPMDAEPPSLTLTRTQPVLVICDCGGSAANFQPLVVEVLSRSLPLLITAPTETDVIRTWVLPDGVAWLEFPISREMFEDTINKALRSGQDDRDDHFILRGGPVALEAALTVQTLDTVRSPRPRVIGWPPIRTL